jgi:hypothetical protein
VTPREFFRPSSRDGRARLPELATAALLAGCLAGCARAAPPSPEVVHRAAGLRSYSASLRVSVSGNELRGRSRALVAFRRPDALRIEIPGTSGARLVAVTREGRLTAVLPAERAVLERDASPPELAALIGIALAPESLMDLLVGQRPAGAREYEARWGRSLPSRVDAVLEDGTRVRAVVEEADSGEAVSPRAFEPPAHVGYRPIDADEARRLLGGR